MLENLQMLLLCLAIFASRAAIAGGGEVGNGGDIYVAQFVQTITQIEKALELHKPTVAESIDLEKLKNMVQTATLESTDQPLELNGVKKDAINYSDSKKIIFNRAAWDRKEFPQKKILALHEFLGLLRIDDTHVSLSSEILRGSESLFNPCEQDEIRFRDWAKQFFEKRGKPLCGNFTGNGTDTLAGTYLRTLRAHSIDKSGYIFELLMIAECNEVTGRYEKRQYSASGSDLPPLTSSPGLKAGLSAPCLRRR